MNRAFSQWRRQNRSALTTQQGRQQLVMGVLNLTQNTSLAPGSFEQGLLDAFVRGELTIDEVLARLEEQNAAQ